MSGGRRQIAHQPAAGVSETGHLPDVSTVDTSPAAEVGKFPTSRRRTFGFLER
jgi:hypothetical protein